MIRRSAPPMPRSGWIIVMCGGFRVGLSVDIAVYGGGRRKDGGVGRVAWENELRVAIAPGGHWSLVELVDGELDRWTRGGTTSCD